MRYLKLLLVLIAPALNSHAQKSYTLSLNFDGVKDGTLVTLLDLDRGQVIDSGRFDNGKLVFRGKVNEMTTGRLHTDDGQYLVVYLENKPISITGVASDFQYAKIEGTETNRLEVESRDWQKSYNKERDSLMTKYFTLRDADSLEQGKLLTRVNKIDRTISDYRLNNIRNSRPARFTLIELFFIRTELQQDTLRSLFQNFPSYLKNNKHGRAIIDYLANKKPAVGLFASEISGKDGKGKTYRLSDLKGKYVLIEFWASWCAPCRYENPNLVKTYEEYHSRGFEILGFSLDTNEEHWQAAITKDKLSWINISELNGYFSKAASAYHVRGIPENFLLDPNGVIIARNLRGDKLNAKLKTLLNK